MLKVSSKKDTVAIDFDGVIHAYSNGWQDGTIYDDPIPGVQEALKKLKEDYHIIIFSTRNHDKTIDGKRESNQVDEMKAYLDKHDIPYDEIYTDNGKPMAKLFVDDNAYRFKGNWHTEIDQIKKILQEK